MTPSITSGAAQRICSAGRSRAVRVVGGLGVSALLLVLSVRAIDVAELLPILRTAAPAWIAASLALYWTELVLRVQRWLTISRPVRPLRFGQVANALLVGYSANNVIPARLGELVRADYIARRFGLSRFSAASTILLERVFDVPA